MCLIHFHYKDHPIYQFILVANRDEFYNRPTKHADFWEDEPSILAGRDLLQMGTWLGVSKNGRFAAITNFRDPTLPERPLSRGDIVKKFLTENTKPEHFINNLENQRESYGGYNVIIGDGNALLHYNNILDEKNEINPGTHSVSNFSLNTLWPKVVKGKSLLSDYVKKHSGKLEIDELFQIVMDREVAPDDQLPNTGVGLEMERHLSASFIHLPHYGTRCSTVLLVDYDQNVTFVERTFHQGEFQFEKRFEFQIES